MSTKGEAMTPVRERVTWIRPDPRRAGRTLTSHPWLWRITEPDGYVRYFDTKRDALAWVAAQSRAELTAEYDIV